MTNNGILSAKMQPLCIALSSSKFIFRTLFKNDLKGVVVVGTAKMRLMTHLHVVADNLIRDKNKNTIPNSPG